MSKEVKRNYIKKPLVIPYEGGKSTIYSHDSIKVIQKKITKPVDFIMTSPPYADARYKTYGGIHPDEYVEWFLPYSKELYNVLKPRGSFILNIKERVVDGQRHTYVFDLIKQMQDQGWLWTEEYIWFKKNPVPGKWPNRFRDGWERCLHFTKQKNFDMYQESVMVDIGSWAKSRLKNLSETDKRRDNSKVNSGFGKNLSNWVGRDKVFPSNVLKIDYTEEELKYWYEEMGRLSDCIEKGIEYERSTNVIELPNVCANKNHSAVYPVALPEWFIKLFTSEGDTALDPFSGSGTTGVAAKKLKRNSILIDVIPEYSKIAEERIINE